MGNEPAVIMEHEWREHREDVRELNKTVTNLTVEVTKLATICAQRPATCALTFAKANGNTRRKPMTDRETWATPQG